MVNIGVPNNTELKQFYYHNTNLYTDPQIQEFLIWSILPKLTTVVYTLKNCKLTTQIYFNPYAVYAGCTNPLSCTQKCIINNFSQNVMYVLLHIVHANI